MRHAIVTFGAFLVAVTLGCGSSAPYTMTSAALNSGLALGASALERSSGGCYAICTNGTVCNPKSGFCEREPAPPPCPPGPGGCGPFLRDSLSVEDVVQQPGSTTVKTFGVSPATGRAPPPPGSPPPASP